MSIEDETYCSDRSSKEEASSHSEKTIDTDSEGSKELKFDMPQELEPEGRREQLESALDDKLECCTDNTVVPNPQEIQWHGFKIVGDNIDRNIRPSMQRLTHQTRSLHHFHSYAVKDRVDWSKVSDVARSSELDVTTMLMNEKDWVKFKGDCEVLISR